MAYMCLVAPYRAILRDYLSDTPLLRAMGSLVSQHDQFGAIPPPPFLSVSPLESMRSGGTIPPPPPQKGYLSHTCGIPYENKETSCDTLLYDTISKGYCAIWGGISHWAAKYMWDNVSRQGSPDKFQGTSCGANVQQVSQERSGRWEHWANRDILTRLKRNEEIQKTVPGRVRVNFAQNGGHEKATKKAQTLFF